MVLFHVWSWSCLFKRTLNQQNNATKQRVNILLYCDILSKLDLKGTKPKNISSRPQHVPLECLMYNVYKIL